jgi:hypothetical protein
MTILKISFYVLIVPAIVACSKTGEEKCIQKEICYAGHMDSIYVGKVGEPVFIEVQFGVNSSCGQFNKFIESTQGNITTIEVEAKYEGCMCLLNAPGRTAYYEFKSKKSGTFILKFKSGPEQFSEVNIHIE